MPSTYLSKTGSGSGATTCTFSAWVKRSELQVASGNPQCIWGWQNVSNSDRVVFHFNNGGSEDFRVYIQNSAGTATEMILATNRQFRDVNSWYHIVIEIDTTQATSSDRAKLYINGVQETSFSTETYPTQNYVLKYMSSTGNTAIGNNGIYSYPYSGLLSHIHYIDGTAYDASYFGETDATTGIWKPKTEPSVTYGTNGFFLKFENSGSMGLDSSGNANNFTVNGSLTQTVDTPSNVFATMNPLNKGASVTLSNGNLTCVGSGTYVAVSSTLAVSTGKWYWEAKCNTASPNNRFNVGILKTTADMANTPWIGSVIESYGYLNDGTIYNNGSQLLDTGTTVSVGDIVGFLLDLDNGTLKLKKNGSDVYSGNAVVSSLNTGDYWYVAQGADVSNVDFNFGNGYFGTTAVSSATSDESGLGIFEYTVPSGYYALCTKNINTQEYD